MKVLITGAAGFIGYHIVKRLVKANYEVVGVDCINDYYNIDLKYNRMADCGLVTNGDFEFNREYTSNFYRNYRFFRLKLEMANEINLLFNRECFDLVIHLAAQAGVRYSIENPWAYINSNIYGMMSILEACRLYNIRYLIYASSSSVYGNSSETPFKCEHFVDSPLSLYAATKKSNELMAHTYSHLYNIYTIGLRFFTVYGPWGRPDMAYYKFVNAIFENKEIELYNNGELWRDFTNIDDIIEGLTLVTEAAMKKPTAFSNSYNIFNLGNSSPIKLTSFIELIEKLLGKKAKLNPVGMKAGDVKYTYAYMEPFEKFFGFIPKVTLEEGLAKFISWYIKYYKIKQ